jgi:hypothetical protein
MEHVKNLNMFLTSMISNKYVYGVLFVLAVALSSCVVMRSMPNVVSHLLDYVVVRMLLLSLLALLTIRDPDGNVNVMVALAVGSIPVVVFEVLKMYKL